MEWKEENQLSENSETENEESDGSSNHSSEENTKNDRVIFFFKFTVIEHFIFVNLFLKQDTIRADLKSMTFSELLKLKEELGSKTYNEALFGNVSTKKRKNESKANLAFKRENKNRPREISGNNNRP